MGSRGGQSHTVQRPPPWPKAENDGAWAYAEVVCGALGVVGCISVLVCYGFGCVLCVVFALPLRLPAAHGLCLFGAAAG